jgi:hypothetical protein
MDYLNPTSIAQMAQVPKDTSLPGSGYGLLQGFNEGQAMMRAKDFLDMSKASQAQNYVKNQFDMQTAWEDYPLAREQKQANLAQTQASTKMNEESLAKAKLEAKRMGVEGQLSIIASMKDQIRNAKGGIERAALYDTMRQQIQRGGFDIDEDLNINPADDASWSQLIQYADTADAITTYNADTRRGIAKDRPKIQSTENIAGKDRISRERMNREDNDTALAIAGIRADAQSAASGGTQELNRWKANLFARWEKTLQKNPKDWTAEEQAINTVASRALASQFTTAAEVTNNPEVQGDIAADKEIKRIEALREMLRKKEKPSDPAQLKPLPNKEEIKGDALPDKKLESLLDQYAPRKK